MIANPSLWQRFQRTPEYHLRWADADWQMRAAMSRLSPCWMNCFLVPGYDDPLHIRYMSWRIRETVQKPNGRLMITAPPRCAKSENVSVATPTWFLEQFKTKRCGITSYAQEKSSEWGRVVRENFETNPGKLSTRLAKDSRAKNRWNILNPEAQRDDSWMRDDADPDFYSTSREGGLIAVGRGGPLTGFGLDLGIVDDPIKDDEESQSETILAKLWDWFRGTFSTRIQPDGSVIICMTRWSTKDLIGKIKALQKELRKQGIPFDEWELLHLPYFAGPKDPLQRPEGRAIWPEIGFDEEWGEKKKHFVGSRVWSSEYQGSPTVEGGSIFKRSHFCYYEVEADHYVLYRRDKPDEPERVAKNRCRVYQTVDTAMKDKELSDWTVVLTIAVTPRHDTIVLDVARAKLDMPDQWGFVKQEVLRYGLNSAEWCWVGVEDKGSGIGVIQTAKRGRLAVRELKATKDKVTRSSQASVSYEGGYVFHPRQATWLEAFEDELVEFPNGEHDDQVDCISYAVRETSMLRDPEIPQPVERKREPVRRSHDRLRDGMAVNRPSMR